VGSIADVVAAGKEAWPKLVLMPETVAEHAARHATPLDTIHAADFYLACGVIGRDRAALAYFEERFMARVPDYLLRLRIGREALDEVKQKLREDLLVGRNEKPPKIAEYSGRGALGGWLRVTAVRTALNHVRASSRAETAQLTEDFSVAGDPELAYVKEHARELFADAFKRVLAGLDASERTILRLHYMDGLTMAELGRLYKTPRSTIARRVAEARERILTETETVLREEQRLSPSALASVLRQAKSRLEVTISRFFG
jgi:RNA polymerase sigma-70 factor (ECF subfamily)